MPIKRGLVGASLGRRGIVLTALVASAACASSEFSTTGPQDQGNYTASVVAGADTTRLSGNAIISTTQNSSGLTYLVFYLWTGTPGGMAYDVFWLQRENLTIPTPGVYTIDDVGANLAAADDFVALYAFADSAAAAATFHSVVGTITVDASAFEEVSGSFEFVAAFDENSYHSGTVADTVRVVGTFRAAPGTIY